MPKITNSTYLWYMVTGEYCLIQISCKERKLVYCNCCFRKWDHKELQKYSCRIKGILSDSFVLKFQNTNSLLLPLTGNRKKRSRYFKTHVHSKACAKSNNLILVGKKKQNSSDLPFRSLSANQEMSTSSLGPQSHGPKYLIDYFFVKKISNYFCFVVVDTNYYIVLN